MAKKELTKAENDELVKEIQDEVRDIK